ncbi:MAG: iron ABC transporter permease [Clostridiales bacterium]|nr:iron ABC transporter permease [Clostridiales bacterium]
MNGNKKRGRMIFFLLLPIILFLISLGIGSYPISPFDVVTILFKGITGNEFLKDPMAFHLLFTVRLPRIISAVLIGAGLSVSGAVFQGLFKNPLADPYTLGVSNGAGFGAGLAIVLSLSTLQIQLVATIFGLFAVLLTFLLSIHSKHSTVSLVLSGMLVGSLFSSLISLIKFTADPFEKLPEIVFWLMGSLVSINYEKILRILPAYVLCMLFLFLIRWRLNVLSLGSEEAQSFGIPVKRDRTLAILACSIITALVVSISGIIGWVGIVIPHLARMIVGADFRKLLPASASLGICYLLLIDDLCRTLTATEIPIGVITGIIGVPLFAYFIYRKKVHW